MHAEWIDDMTYDQFMAELQEKKRTCSAANSNHDNDQDHQTSVVLVLDKHFWVEYHKLSSAKRTALLTVIQSIPFSVVEFPDPLPVLRQRWLLSRWWKSSTLVLWQLVQVLQSMTTITELIMDMAHIENVPRIQSDLIRAFDRITRFELRCYDN